MTAASRGDGWWAVIGIFTWRRSVRIQLTCRPRSHTATNTGGDQVAAGTVLVFPRQRTGLLSARRILQRSLARSAGDDSEVSSKMSSFKINCAALTCVMLVGGCVQPPLGPTVPVMPAPNKSFDAFRSDQAVCMDYASQQVNGGVQAANNQQVLTGVAGTVLGAGLGAALGGGRGAAVGAAYGAGAGTLYGAGGAQQAQMSLQQRYDLNYAQCMYGHGDQVPGFEPEPTYSIPAGRYYR
jgi:outer membrane lipoprotein SlyB